MITDVGDASYYKLRAVELIYSGDCQQAIQLLALAIAETEDGATPNKKERKPGNPMVEWLLG